jgi:glycosyltransferase involved in cell wall biosynthesis
VLAAGGIARARREFQPDLVHAHNPAMAAAVALATMRGRRPRALASMHGVRDDDYARAARVLRAAGLPVVACGPGVAAALEELGCPVSKTIVNGVGAPPPAADRAALLSELRIPAQTRLLLAVGRLVEQKNHALAIRALRWVPDAVLLIVGDGPLRSSLEHEAIATGLADRTIFAGRRDDARALIAAADVVLLPSQWEGLPLVALEALAAGTPVVATAVRGNRELLTHEKDCLLVPKDDAEALAAATARLLSDVRLRASLRAAGLQVAASYSEEAMVTRFLDLYAALVADSNERPRGS